MLTLSDFSQSLESNGLKKRTKEKLPFFFLWREGKRQFDSMLIIKISLSICSVNQFSNLGIQQFRTLKNNIHEQYMPRDKTMGNKT